MKFSSAEIIYYLCTADIGKGGCLVKGTSSFWSVSYTHLDVYKRQDYGNTWTACQPSRFTSPNGPLSMKRDENGVLYAIWNPIPQYNGREEPGKVFMGGRTPYVIAVSRDNGQTFTEPVSFEEEEDHGYCYCAIHFTKDAMLLAYCAGGPEDGLSLIHIYRLRKKHVCRKGKRHTLIKMV